MKLGYARISTKDQNFDLQEDALLKSGCEWIIRLSPVAWQHINLVGRYEFNGDMIPLDLQGIIEKLINNSEIDFASAS